MLLELKRSMPLSWSSTSRQCIYTTFHWLSDVLRYEKFDAGPSIETSQIRRKILYYTPGQKDSIRAYTLHIMIYHLRYDKIQAYRFIDRRRSIINRTKAFVFSELKLIILYSFRFKVSVTIKKTECLKASK